MKLVTKRIYSFKAHYNFFFFNFDNKAHYNYSLWNAPNLTNFLFFSRLKFYQYQMHTLLKGDILRETTSAHTILRILT